MSTDLPFHARFAGLDWSADLPLDQFDSAAQGQSGAIAVVRQAAPGTIQAQREVGRARIGSNGVRFDCDDEVALEMRGGETIGWVPGPDWTGQLPVSFFSSMAAITVAWRGLLPLHASSVVIGGKAWLIAGGPGAGKSTLTAELLSAGAKLLADDLTVLTPGPQPMVWRGRPAMRLHPTTCDLFEQTAPPEPAQDERGKLLVRPAARAADRAWPIGGILLLSNIVGREHGLAETAMAYGSILFRPRIISALPGHKRLRKGLLELTRAAPMGLIESLWQFDPDSRAARIERVFDTVARLEAGRSTV
ncbi:MAG: hypothetical protein ACKOQM_11475 [Novosphingobium sp.]